MQEHRSANTEAAPGNQTDASWSEVIDVDAMEARHRQFVDSFEKRWAAAGLDEIHRDFFTQRPDTSTNIGRLQRKLMDLPAGFLVAIIGGRGPGKTQAAQNLAGCMLAAGYNNTPRYTYAADMFRLIRDAQRNDSSLSETQVVESFVSPTLLIIDDLHDRGETDPENRHLNNILSKRHAAKRSTILISNSDRREFRMSIGLSIADRLEECGEIIECPWKSLRTKKIGQSAPVRQVPDLPLELRPRKLIRETPEERRKRVAQLEEIRRRTAQEARQN